MRASRDFPKHPVSPARKHPVYPARTVSHVVWRMCAKKSKYRTEAVAEAIRQKREAVGIAGLRTYHCPICAQWHLSHKK